MSIFALGALTPVMVLHGAIWQLVTYSFLSGGIFQVAFDMLSLWFIGSYLETTYGTRWLTEIYFFSVIGAGADNDCRGVYTRFSYVAGAEQRTAPWAASSACWLRGRS